MYYIIMTVSVQLYSKVYACKYQKLYISINCVYILFYYYQCGRVRIMLKCSTMSVKLKAE